MKAKIRTSARIAILAMPETSASVVKNLPTSLATTTGAGVRK